MPSYKVKLEICGSLYTVSTNDSTEYLTGLAERLDGDMKQMMQSSSNSSVVSAAIITALGYLDEETKTRQAADNMRAQIQDYLEDAAKAKLAAEEARREAERLRRELSYYEKKSKSDSPEKPKSEPIVTVPPPSVQPQKPLVPEEKPVAQAERVIAPQNTFSSPAVAVPLPKPPLQQTASDQDASQLELEDIKGTT